jgi:hypothetical protein
MFDTISNIFFAVFSVYGLIALATFGLYVLALKLRATPLSWILAFALGCAAAYTIEFVAEFGLMMASAAIPFHPWTLAPYAMVAIASVWVSGHAKPSRWPIAIPSIVIAALALQHGVRTGENASTFAGIITAIVGLICWFFVPREFKVDSGATLNEGASQ